jgi:phosphoribosyl 1,2-cyclic phosphate phosphodiesterase
MKIRILGCGGSQGVPDAAGDWGACDPSDPRNRRSRPSILIEADRPGQGPAALLVDTAPELRLQLAGTGVRQIDAVIYTHAHADHLHGIDDLRPINKAMGRPIPIWGTPETLAEIGRRFEYALAPQPATGTFFRPTLEPHEIHGPFEAAGVPVLPFEQDHGQSASLGLRVGRFAYSTDVVRLDDAAFDMLAGIDVWIVDCIRFAPHWTHSHLESTLGWIERVKPRRAILTHMDCTLDYATLQRQLPPGVEPAYDGMEIEL